MFGTARYRCYDRQLWNVDNVTAMLPDTGARAHVATKWREPQGMLVDQHSQDVMSVCHRENSHETLDCFKTFCTGMLFCISWPSK
jgi:hypothetical protein